MPAESHPLVRALRPLNGKERDRLSRLDRRREYLESRTAESEGAKQYRVAEISALDWAINLLRGDTSPRPTGLTEADEVTVDVLRDTVREALEKYAANPWSWSITDVTESVTGAIVDLFEVRLIDCEDTTDPVDAARRRT